MRGRKPLQSKRYDRKSVYQVHMAFIHKICKLRGYVLSNIIYAAHLQADALSILQRNWCIRQHVHRMEEEVRHRVSLPPKDDLDTTI
ncbi:hypothetical protein EVAR_55085_1 [Eumeta japonica]|uniref:Uncharacterized protein n=1 Tax=Eumeta variegata TaxID=151549 RepID=A0A4C1YKF1_EUMVA|nr:hypothetical protein EVAR_55085_1 [Eumeta japonica]